MRRLLSAAFLALAALTLTAQAAELLARVGIGVAGKAGQPPLRDRDMEAAR